jgi:hypothetical protein
MSDRRPSPFKTLLDNEVCTLIEAAQDDVRIAIQRLHTLLSDTAQLFDALDARSNFEPIMQSVRDLNKLDDGLATDREFPDLFPAGADFCCGAESHSAKRNVCVSHLTNPAATCSKAANQRRHQKTTGENAP